MDRFIDAKATFGHAIERARQMVALFDALAALRPREPANDDALRSAYILAVSSFDFLVHEVAAVEARYRFANSLKTQNINLPMNLMTIINNTERVEAAEIHVRKANSYKAFVDPAKLAELLSCYCSRPWDKLSERINDSSPPSEQRAVDEIKGQLKSIWKRRNQIAHEADVNPTLAGVSLWTIDKIDAEITINFLSLIGEKLPEVISIPIQDSEQCN